MRVVFGPFYKTEFFFGLGMGYHSNDARGVTATEAAGDPTQPQSAVPLLVRSARRRGRRPHRAIAGLDSSVSLFVLDQASELFFDGDTGDTTPGRPSRRTGIEFTNDYRPVSWMHIDADLALTRARFLGFDSAQEQIYQSLAGFPQAQIGNAPGNFVFNAPWLVASAGITLGEDTGWFGALRWRYISSRPLTEDGAFRSAPLSVFNGRIGYRFADGWRIQLDGLNLFNTTIGPGRICLRLAAQDRQPVRPVLSGERRLDGTGRRLPERRDGLCAASDGAARSAADFGEDLLDCQRSAGWPPHGRTFCGPKLLFPSSKKCLRFVML